LPAGFGLSFLRPRLGHALPPVVDKISNFA
jgi:hypothetical protein